MPVSKNVATCELNHHPTASFIWCPYGHRMPQRLICSPSLHSKSELWNEFRIRRKLLSSKSSLTHNDLQKYFQHYNYYNQLLVTKMEIAYCIIMPSFVCGNYEVPELIFRITLMFLFILYSLKCIYNTK